MPVLPLETTLNTRDGLKLVAEHYLLRNPRGRVLVLHGLAEHRQRYRKLAAELTGAGYACHLLDLRGHGCSEGARGHVSRFSDYRDDLDLFVKQVNQQSLSLFKEDDEPEPRVVHIPRVPPFIFGHSFGGLVAINYVLHRPDVFDGLAVSSPFLAPAFKLPPLANEICGLAAYLFPKLSLPIPIKPQWLTRDESVIEAYKKDPLIFSTVTSSWWHAVRGAQGEAFERATEIKTPVLLLLGDADKLADWRQSKAVFERLGSVNKHLNVYPGFFHELFNELGREQVIQDFISWLHKVSRQGTDVIAS